MATPFNERDGFEMRATCFDGSVFLEEDHAYKVKSQAQQMRQTTRPGRPSQDAMSYWGYKFETLCLLNKPWAETSRETIESRPETIVNNHAQYCSVVRTGIGGTILVLGGEVDALWDSKPEPGEPINWVELKTSVDPRSDRDMLNYEFKLLKFWIQSFLLGVPKIIVGFRDQHGTLLRVEEMATATIPNMVKTRGRATWDGSMCCNFAAAFLDFLKETVVGDGVWRISKKPNASVIEVFREEECGHGDIVSDEFINWRIKLRMRSVAPPPE